MTPTSAKAETVKLPEDRAVRLNELSAGTAPDLVGFDSSDLPRVAGLGYLTNLTPIIDADPEVKPEEVFFESVWNTGFVDDQPVAIAKDYSVSAFYANTGLLENAGIEVPKEGWTYDDYLNIAQQLTLDENALLAAAGLRPDKVVQWAPARLLERRHRLVARLSSRSSLWARTIGDDSARPPPAERTAKPSKPGSEYRD
jgi:ABC-type glycerol-3-phosphate transport system substrate-binding protein